MTAKPRFNKLKRQLDKLRRDSFAVVSNANRIVSTGVQKLADKELKALNDYYHSALESIRHADKKEGIKGLAQHQLDLLQDTANQVISNARESLAIVAEARTELSKLVQKAGEGINVTKREFAAAAEPAMQAVKKTRMAAKKAATVSGGALWDATVAAKKNVKSTVTRRQNELVPEIKAAVKSTAKKIVAAKKGVSAKKVVAAKKAIAKATPVTKVVMAAKTAPKKTVKPAAKAVVKAAAKAVKPVKKAIKPVATAAQPVAKTVPVVVAKGAWKSALTVAKAPSTPRVRRDLGKVKKAVATAAETATSAVSEAAAETASS